MNVSPTTRLLVAVAGALLLFIAAGTGPDISAEELNDPIIVSMLQHGETVIVSTYDGLYQASLKDKLWRKMETPPLMTQGGKLMQQGAGSPVLAYYGHSTYGRERENIGQGLSLEVPVFKKTEVLFVSKNAGATWEQVQISQGHHIEKVFLHPNAALYVCDFERSAFVIPSNVITGARVVCSKDMGVTWKDITTNLPKDYSFHEIFQDPDHPDQVCVVGSLEGMLSRPFVFQADDGTYQWQQKEIKTCHEGMAGERLSRSLEGSPDALVINDKKGEIIHATLSNFFTMPFLKVDDGDAIPNPTSLGTVPR